MGRFEEQTRRRSVRSDSAQRRRSSSSGGGSSGGVTATFEDPNTRQIISERFESREQAKQFVKDVAEGRVTTRVIRAGGVTVGTTERGQQKGQRLTDERTTVQTVQNQSLLEPNISLAEGGVGFAFPPVVRAKTSEEKLQSLQEQPIPKGTVTATPQREPNFFQRALGQTRAGRILRTGAAVERQTGAGEQLIQGFTLKPQEFSAARPKTALGRGFQDVAFTAGVAGGIFVAGKGGEIVKAGRSATQAAQATRAGQALARFTATKGGRILTSGVTIATTGELGRRGGLELAKTRFTPAERQTIESRRFRQAEAAGERAFERAVEKEPFFKGIVSQIPPGQLFISKGSFESGVEQNLRTLGVPEAEITRQVGLATRSRSARTFSEITGFLTGSGATELRGGGAFAQTFKTLGRVPKGKVTSKLFIESFKITAPLGFFEAGSQEFIQQRARLKPFRARDIAIEGGLGAASAGVIGGAIAGFKVTRPAVSGVINLGANIADPFEFPGDVLATGVRRSRRFFTGAPIITPTVTAPLSKSETFTFGTTQKKPSVSSKTLVRGGRATPPISVPVITPTPAFIPTTPTAVPTTPTAVPTQSIIPVDSTLPIITPSQTPIEIPDFTKQSTETTTDVPINVPVTTTISIPNFVSTPIVRAPPPLFPLFNGFGSGRGGARIRRKRVFVNELQQGRRLLRNILGGGLLAPKQRKRPATKRKKSKRRK